MLQAETTSPGGLGFGGVVWFQCSELIVGTGWYLVVLTAQCRRHNIFQTQYFILSWCLIALLLKNNYIDTSLQRNPLSERAQPVLLFAHAMNMVDEATEVEYRGLLTKSDV